MGVNLQKGQKVDLTKNNPGLANLVAGLGWDTNKSGGADFDLDASAFLLKSDGKAADNADFIFYGNLNHTSGAVSHMGDNLTGEGEGDDEQIKVNLGAVPAFIDKIAFAVTIHEAQSRNQNFGQVSNAYIRIFDPKNNQELIRYNLGKDFSLETAVVVGEIYRYNGEWKFSAIGGGFRGGLKALCEHFGIDPVKEGRSVELKKGHKVNLEKRGATLGEILINLNWSQPQKSSFAFSPQAIDLDLGCLFEFKNGFKGGVQALGNSFGNFDNPPYISLDGDDRTGSSVGGENLRINGKMISQIKRILVYTFVYDGVVNWRDADGVVTLKCPGSRDLVVKMDEYGANQLMCAIALLENYNDETFSVEKVVRFFKGHEEMDRAFNWGLTWRAGTK